MDWIARSVLSCVALVFVLIVWAALARAFVAHQNTEQSHFDTLIVLGDPVDPDGNPSPTEQARVAEAVREYERGAAQRIIFTGGPAHNRFIEAQVMAETAKAQGIPATDIIEDRRALNTIQNACNSLRIMRSHGWDSAEVITSPNHLPRSAMIFSRLPLKWRMEPAPPLGPEPATLTFTTNAIEIIKTVHYLFWSRQTESCPL
jgi:uncharacterized SAM-binding protein YcdF (DUF218 family)